MRLVTCWGLLQQQAAALAFTEGRRELMDKCHMPMILMLPSETGGLSSGSDPVSKEGSKEEGAGREGGRKG